MQIILSTLFPANKIGAIIVFIVAVGTGELGKKLDKGYKCPVYCGVDHIHIRRCTDEEKIYYQGINGLYRGTKRKDRKQSESYLRSEGGIRIECSD